MCVPTYYLPWAIVINQGRREFEKEKKKNGIS